MSTALEIITDSLKKLGVYSSGESLDSDIAIESLRTLNQMLSGWNTSTLTVVGKAIETFTLVVGQSSYTLGSGGDFNTAVPIKTDSVYIRDNSGFDRPLEIIDAQKWGGLNDKTTSATYPTHVYIDNNFPLQKVYLYPIPNDTNTLVMHNQRKLSALATLSTSLSLPDGYERAIVYNLALELAPEYGKTPSNEVITTANNTLADIKRVNIKPHRRRVDNALLKGGGFNWRTGE